MSINIDGRDCCQTGQPSQDVTDGALTAKDGLNDALTFMTYQKSHHLPFDYSLFPPALTLITAALIIVCFVVLLLMPFPGVPLAGRAVVNGASEAVSALAGFHP